MDIRFAKPIGHSKHIVPKKSAQPISNSANPNLLQPTTNENTNKEFLPYVRGEY